MQRTKLHRFTSFQANCGRSVPRTLPARLLNQPFGTFKWRVPIFREKYKNIKKRLNFTGISTASMECWQRGLQGGLASDIVGREIDALSRAYATLT